MNKKTIAVLTILLLCLGCLQTASAESIAQTEASSKIESFKAGGTSINIPAPSELVEVGYDVREQMEIFISTTNRLLSAYMIPDEIPRFLKGDKDLVLSQSASVQVLRQNEYQDFKESDFNELVDYIKSSSSDELASIADETEAEFNRRMEALNLDKISIDEPIELGSFFSKPDAYSFGMISSSSDGKKTWKVVISTTFLRVKNRLLFTYFTSEYKDNDSIVKVQSKTEKWVDAILAANP